LFSSSWALLALSYSANLTVAIDFFLQERNENILKVTY
jgi:hypothetical protein